MKDTLEEEIVTPSRKEIKLINAHENNLKISRMNLNNKFQNFENSIYNESKTLLFEATVSPTRFKRYSRGRIVKIKFGVNIGSEFSGDHFAIVVSKKDTMMNPTLHVIPITSKEHKKNIGIGSIMYNDELLKELIDLKNVTEDKKEQKKINKIIKYYKNRENKQSYACIDHMKTVSKLSILNPMNEFDYITKIKCDNETMKKIDEAVIQEYTI